jgi:WhiB family redox-sensing transcriptional regulator
MNTRSATADERGDWRARGPCRSDPDLFFSSDPDDIAQAQRICASCPVRAECASFAEANGEMFGVWAGVDRSALSRRRPSPRRTRRRRAA